MGSPRVQSFDVSMQEQLRREDVDFIDERRWQAAIQNAQYLVLRRILNREGLHKLSPSWEGPFKVT
jgi:hypothetical protein